ncbi:MAG: transposase [Methylococcaceae bacterium]|nr:transposase [Methylococcaceae bacterium]
MIRSLSTGPGSHGPGGSRLEPFKRLGKTLKAHLPGILAACRHGTSNAVTENRNSQIQAASVRARGFKSLRSLTNIIFLTTGKLENPQPTPSLMPSPRQELSTGNGREPENVRAFTIKSSFSPPTPTPRPRTVGIIITPKRPRLARLPGIPSEPQPRLHPALSGLTGCFSLCSLFDS